MMKTIGCIGCGNMGEAIIRSLAAKKTWELLIHDTRKEHALRLARETDTVALDLTNLMQRSHIIILAVKPQVLPSLYKDLSTAPKETLWISVAAGVSLETLSCALGTTNIVRIMPNIAASVQKAVTAISPHPLAKDSDITTVEDIVQTFGTAHRIEEAHMAAFIGVSGSAIATCFAFLHGIALGGVAQGLPYQLALSLICDTMDGATALTRNTQRHPEELATTVCSPGGTTIEAIRTILDQKFSSTLIESVAASSNKARYLEKMAKETV